MDDGGEWGWIVHNHPSLYVWAVHTHFWISGKSSLMELFGLIKNSNTYKIHAVSCLFTKHSLISDIINRHWLTIFRKGTGLFIISLHCGHCYLIIAFIFSLNCSSLVAQPSDKKSSLLSRNSERWICSIKKLKQFFFGCYKQFSNCIWRPWGTKLLILRSSALLVFVDDVQFKYS